MLYLFGENDEIWYNKCVGDNTFFYLEIQTQANKKPQGLFLILRSDKSLEVFHILGGILMSSINNVNPDNTSLIQNINSIADTAERISDASSNRETQNAFNTLATKAKDFSDFFAQFVIRQEQRTNATAN